MTQKQKTPPPQGALSKNSSEAAAAPFAEIIGLIGQSRMRSYQTVTTELVGLYLRIGQYISQKLAAAEWTDGVVEQLAQQLARSAPGLHGFSPHNLFRMRQFYETYVSEQNLSSVLTQLPWGHHLLIMARCPAPEAREFYIRSSVREKWGKNQLERQLRTALFERSIRQPTVVKSNATLPPPVSANIFKDVYLLEFLDPPVGHVEADLHHGLVKRLQHFLSSLGPDFCFLASQYPVEAKGKDHSLDLLFFHRPLNCLLAIEVKVGRREAEHLAKLNLFLDALDRAVRKPHENPSIGMLLCASKGIEVVEYAFRNLSVAQTAEFQARLPEPELFRAKLREFYEITFDGGDTATALKKNQAARRKARLPTNYH
jgi:predicted nuclease of restriction endonuclease-like (RecB) superfamily